MYKDQVLEVGCEGSFNQYKKKFDHSSFLICTQQLDLN